MFVEFWDTQGSTGYETDVASEFKYKSLKPK